MTAGFRRPSPAPSGPAPSGPAPSVALIHYAVPPVIGGVETVLARHAVLMADAGLDVRVIAGRGRRPDPRVGFVRVPLLDPRHPVIRRLQRALDAGEIPGDFADVAETIASGLRAALEGVDIVIAHNVCSLGLNLALTSALLAVAGRAGRPRLILWHHDLAAAMPSYRATLHPGMPWDLLREARPGVEHVVVSAARRDALADIVGIPPEAIEVIPNGVDLEKLWRLGRRTVSLMTGTGAMEMTPLLLMPSRIIRRKNVELAMGVVKAMREAGCSAALIVTGPVDPHHAEGDAYLRQLQTLRRDLGLDAAVWFIAPEMGGPPDDAVMGDLYRLADALILPSRDEGFGLPILEAAAHRLPMICTDLPALRRLAGDAALYIGADDDPERVAARILERLDGDPVARLATEVRTRHTWAAVYRDRIAPLLRRDAPRAPSGARGAV